MNSYRLYLLNRQERVDQALVREHPNDEAAVQGAIVLQPGHHAVEIWEGARLVGRLGGEFSLQS
jgi:hypothetical protein